MLIDRIDYVLDHSAVGSNGWDDPNLAPTDALRRNFWFCTIDIPSTMSLREHIGIDHICLESDYPHADSTWPDTQTARARRPRRLHARRGAQGHVGERVEPVPSSGSGRTATAPHTSTEEADMLDLKLSGGTVVDGTGGASRRADVGIRDGRIVEIGDIDESATRTIDATDLVVAPGFVDLHTHYDAQLLWDATASPSPMHGVTTVFGGNCGFTLAPASDEHVDYLARSWRASRASRSPRCSRACRGTGRRSATTSIASRGSGTAVNAGFLTGHSALRRVVMGADAVGEAASRRADHRDGTPAARRARRGRDGLLHVAGPHAQRR